MDDATTTTVVEVLRHAKACSREAWVGGDDSRPLDDAGWIQSKHLTRDLAATPLAAIYCSPATRCVQTVEALADASGTAIETDERLAALHHVPVTDAGNPWPAAAWLGGRAVALVGDGLTEHRGERLLICSHGDVLAAFLAAIAGRDGLDLHDVSLRKGARLTLTFDREGRCRGFERHPAALKRPT